MHTLSLLTSAVLAARLVFAYNCIDFQVPLVVTAPSYSLKFPPFENQEQALQLLLDANSRVANTTYSPSGKATNVTQHFNISGRYCSPAGRANGDVQILSHGLGFAKNYWHYGNGSDYNYALAATDAGYATLSYDRLGNGLSTVADPYTIAQGPMELAILVSLTEKLRDGTLNKDVPRPTGRTLHVGHSYGSILSQSLAAKHPQLSDGLVLTGYSTDFDYQSQFQEITGFHIANQNSPRFKGKSNGYLTWGDAVANQYIFFKYPTFSPAVLDDTEATKQTFSIGELITGRPPMLDFNATSFTGPVLLFSGDADLVFCGSDCAGILESTIKYFPRAKTFKTYIQPNTGHNINLQYNATAGFRIINEFLTNQK